VLEGDWSDLNNGLALTFGGQIKDMVIYNGDLIVLGWMAMVDGIPTQNLAKWDGTKWCNFRNNFNGTAEAIAIYNNEIVVSCRDSMDLEPVKYIAKWIGGNQSDSCGVVGLEEIDLETGITIYPNPNSGKFTIDIRDFENVRVEVYTISGQLVLQESLIQYSNQVDLTEYSKGMYFVKMKTDNKTIVRKIVYY
jgi:type IX secretion system substrate protein